MIPHRRHLVALAAALLLTGCGDDRPDVAVATTTGPVTTAAEVTTTTAAPDPAYRTWIANVRPEVAAVSVFDAPGGTPLDLALTNPMLSGAPATFRIVRHDVEAAGGRWHEVYLPVRPNGLTGWIADADITLTTTDLAVTVRLGEHRLELTDQGEVVATYPIAAGATDTPTPTGDFFVKELIETPSPAGTYGPLAYGLSAYSTVLLDTEAFKDGVIGIHGTDAPQLIGQDVSHGCVRLRNEDILDLQAHQVPLGMPVTITA